MPSPAATESCPIANISTTYNQAINTISIMN